MLGINEKREPIKAPFVRQMQETLQRFLSGNLNEQERAQEERDLLAASRYEIEWN